MRKVFCLFIVLFIAGLASAATVEFQGPAEVSPGETVILSVFSDTPVKKTTVHWINDNGADGWAANLVLNPAYYPWWPPIILPTFNDPQTGNLIDNLALGASSFGAPLVEGVLFSFDYTVASDITVPSVITISVDGNSDGIIIQGMTMNVIPEPITIALLGLGSILISRRKY